MRITIKFGIIRIILPLIIIYFNFEKMFIIVSVNINKKESN